MGWLEVKVRTHREGAPALETLLEDAGAVSVTLVDAEDEPLFEPGPGETPLWNHIVLTGLFPQDTDAKALHQELVAAWAPDPLPPLRFTELQEQNWVRAWLDDFKPMRFGQKLWVCPSWWLADRDNGNSDKAGENIGETVGESAGKSTDTAVWMPAATDAAAWEERHADLLQAMQEPGNAVLRLDPGLAFGTGTHPTTSLCLQWLDSRDLKGLTLVDYGCGSGILGIAALLLGAALVYGIDNDPQALQATADNCHKNYLELSRFPTFLPVAYTQKLDAGTIGTVDGVMANILAGTLVQLAELLALRVRSGGWILLSGILREQAEAVVAAYTPWFHDFAVATEGDWVRISATRL